MAEVVKTNAGAASLCVLVVHSISIILFQQFLPLHSYPLNVLDDQNIPK